jgi:hypothetical protein
MTQPAARREVARSGRRREVDPLRSGKRRVVVENRALQRLQVFARLEPELVAKGGSRGLVRVEGLRLPPGAIERNHQMAA